MKRLAVCLAAGLLAAFAFLFAGFLVGVYLSRSVWYFITLPGVMLKRLADVWFVPSGPGFFLGSQSQGAHHIFTAICILAVWVPVFFAVFWFLGTRRAEP